MVKRKQELKVFKKTKHNALMLLVRLSVLTTKPVAQPWRCQSYSDAPHDKAGFPWQEELNTYLHNKGVQTKLQNTKSDKLKDNIDAVDKQIQNVNVVCVFWKGTTKQILQVLLENSSVCTYTLDQNTGNITKVIIDHLLEDFIPYSRAIVSSAWGATCVLIGLSNKHMMFIQPKKTVHMYEVKKQSDLSSSIYADAAEAVREIVLDENRKLVIANNTKYFNVCSMVSDKKETLLMEVDKYVPTPTPKNSSKTRFPRFSALHNDHIYSIEEKPSECIELQVFKFTKRKLTLHNSVKMPYNKGTDLQLRCGDLSPDESVWALGFSDGTVIVYSIHLCIYLFASLNRVDLTTGSDKVVNPFAKGYVMSIKWNKTSSVLCVCYREGSILLLDRCLQPIDLMFDDGSSVFILDIPAILGKKVKVMSASWASEGGPGIGPFGASRSSSKADIRPKEFECAYDVIAIALHGGPIVTVRVELGAFNKGKLSNSVLLNMRMSNLQIQEALELVLSLSSNTEFYLCFSLMVDFLLKVDSFDPFDYLELLFEKCWQLFIDQGSKFLEPARNLYIRFANRLIQQERFEAAFKAAVRIDTPEVFMQLRMYSAGREQLISEAATQRLQKHYNVYNAFNIGLMKKIIDDANEHKDEAIDMGLQLESEGKISSARELYQAQGQVEEERRVNLISRFVPDVG